MRSAHRSRSVPPSTHHDHGSPGPDPGASLRSAPFLLRIPSAATLALLLTVLTPVGGTAGQLEGGRRAQGEDWGSGWGWG